MKCFWHILGEAEIHALLKTQNMGIVNLLNTEKLWENKYSKVFGFLYILHYSVLHEIKTHKNPKNMENNWILIVRETYGKTQTFQSYGFLTYFICGSNTYNSQNMRKVNCYSKEKISQQAHNVYSTLALGHIYVTSYMNVYKTLSRRYHIMTDDSPSRGTCNTPSFPTILDYDGLGQNTHGNNTLETNL